jgi:hypothetical protein
MTRRLSLRREALAPLDDAQLALVNGAAAPPTVPVDECFTAPFPPISGHTCVDCLTRAC